MTEPWIAVKIGAVRHPKVLELPSHAARWGLVVMWSEAKKQRPSGVFRSETVARALLGEFSRFIPAYIAGGFIHRAPVECGEKRCAKAYADLPSPSLAVHDWHVYQREGAIRQLAWRENHPERTGADRTRSWRLRTAIFERDEYTCRYCGQKFDRQALVAEHVIPADREDSTDDLTNLVAACYSCNYKKGGQTPEEAGMLLLPCPTVTSDTSLLVRDVSRDVSSDNHSRALLIVDSQESLSSTEGGPGETDDLWKLYGALTHTIARKPSVLDWLDRIETTYGLGPAAVALRAEHAKDPNPGTLLSRTSTCLEVAARKAEKANGEIKRSARIQSRVMERRLEEYHFTGKWREEWGPVPSGVPGGVS